MSHGMFVWTLPTGKRMACNPFDVQYVAEGYGRRRVLQLTEREGEFSKMVEYEAKESFDDLLQRLGEAKGRCDGLDATVGLTGADKARFVVAVAEASNGEAE